MIFLIGHIVFAIFGLTALLKGKVSLSEDSEISGSNAKWIGFLALLTYPITCVFGFCFGFYWGTYHRGEEIPLWTGWFVNLGAFLIVGIGIFLVARRAMKTKPAVTEPLSTGEE